MTHAGGRLLKVELGLSAPRAYRVCGIHAPVRKRLIEPRPGGLTDHRSLQTRGGWLTSDRNASRTRTAWAGDMVKN